MKPKTMLFITMSIICLSSLSCLFAENRTAEPTMELAINPLFLAAGTFNTEFETVVNSRWSAGANLWYEFDNVEARFAYLKLLYHPLHPGLEGLGLGPTAGVITRYREEGKPEQQSSDTAPTLGAIVQYNWLLGKRDNWLLGLGFNLHATLKDYADNSPLRRFDGDLRLMCGYAW